jgi:hypothetical protein
MAARRWQLLATSGNVSAAPWQPKGRELAADGCGNGSKWQRIGRELATFGSAAQPRAGHGARTSGGCWVRLRSEGRHYANYLQNVKFSVIDLNVGRDEGQHRVDVLGIARRCGEMQIVGRRAATGAQFAAVCRADVRGVVGARPVFVGRTRSQTGGRSKCYGLYDAPLWDMAQIVSRLHWVWIKTIGTTMRTDFSYTNTIGWNTFPVPALTEKSKADLTRRAEDILLTREADFPSSIADLYDPDEMPVDLREARERNYDVLKRIYIGRRFHNDTERLEKLFDLYTTMTASAAAKPARRAKA